MSIIEVQDMLADVISYINTPFPGPSIGETVLGTWLLSCSGDIIAWLIIIKVYQHSK